MSNPTLVLIDGHSLAFRAFHAIPLSLTSPSGELTNAVFGFTSMLLNVLREQAPEYVVVAFDVGRTFRHEMYDAYKGHRERMPDELRDQVERIKEVVNTLNIPVFTAEGYEADDVLATLARQAAGQGVHSLIVTGDRDILQVVDEHIRVLTSGRQFSDTIIYDPAAVEAKYGLRPDQLVDLKALVGDKSDNIPGVRGIGEKGATDLLQKYGTLDAVYEHLDEVKPDRARNALTEGRESAELSHRLGQITTAVPVQLDLAACRTRDYDRARVVALFQDLAFRSLVEKLPGTEGDTETRRHGDTETRRHGDTETRRHGDTETRRHGDRRRGSSWGCSRPRRRMPMLPIYQSTNLQTPHFSSPPRPRWSNSSRSWPQRRRLPSTPKPPAPIRRRRSWWGWRSGGRRPLTFETSKVFSSLHPDPALRRDQPALGNGPRGAAADLR